MAKKKNTKTKYRTKTVKQYASRAMKKSGSVVSGLIAGAGGALINKFAPLGVWAQPAADLATGYFMNNDTLQTIGGRSIGAMVASGAVNGNGNGGNGNGGNNGPGWY